MGEQGREDDRSLLGEFSDDNSVARRGHETVNLQLSLGRSNPGPNGQPGRLRLVTTRHRVRRFKDRNRMKRFESFIRVLDAMGPRDGILLRRRAAARRRSRLAAFRNAASTSAAATTAAAAAAAAAVTAWLPPACTSKNTGISCALESTQSDQGSVSDIQAPLDLLGRPLYVPLAGLKISDTRDNDNVQDEAPKAVLPAVSGDGDKGKAVVLAGTTVVVTPNNPEAEAAGGIRVMKTMPTVTTTGDGPSGKRIEGFLYQYMEGSVCIVCLCHGRFLSPAEFVLHAGGTDLANATRNITVLRNSL